MKRAEFVSFTCPTAFRLDRLVGAFSTPTYVSKHLDAPGVSGAKLNWDLNQMHKKRRRGRFRQPLTHSLASVKYSNWPDLYIYAR
jgi:hypothetical protein